MTSYLTWLDYSDRERRKMLDVIHALEESDTIDELGLGSIRDAVADRFFPGTGTVQTRARYLFFISWMYIRLEQRRVPSSRIADRARREELRLIERFLEQGITESVIGNRARRRLKRLPSNIYWLGLGTLGFRRFSGTQSNYHQSLDFYYRRLSAARDRSSEDDDIVVLPNWNPQIPPPPDDFPEYPTFDLERGEAEFLLEQLKLHAGNSVFAWLAEHGRYAEEVDFLWDHPQRDDFPQVMQEEIRHAQLFSLAVYGASLLYNLMLGEKGLEEFDAENSKWEDTVDEYSNRLSEWNDEVQALADAYGQWEPTAFDDFLKRTGARVTRMTQSFLDEWLHIVRSGPPRNLSSNKTCRSLIEYRERQLKKGNARLSNRAALENWSGASMNNQLSYRWRNARTILHDIYDGLGRN